MRDDCYITLSGPRGDFPEVLGNPNIYRTTEYSIKYKIITSTQILEKIKQNNDIWIIKFSPRSRDELTQKSLEIINTVLKLHQLYQHYSVFINKYTDYNKKNAHFININLENRRRCLMNSYQQITRITMYLKVEIEKNTMLKLIDGEIKTLYSSSDLELMKIPLLFRRLDKYLYESEANIRQLEIKLQELSLRFQIENMIIGAILGSLIGIVFTILVFG